MKRAGTIGKVREIPVVPRAPTSSDMLAALADSDRHLRHGCVLSFVCGFVSAMLLLAFWWFTR